MGESANFVAYEIVTFYNKTRMTSTYTFSERVRVVIFM